MQSHDYSHHRHRDIIYSLTGCSGQFCMDRYVWQQCRRISLHKPCYSFIFAGASSLCADQYTESKTILPAKYLQLPYNVANLGEVDAHTAVGLDHNLVDAGTNKLAILGMRSRRRAVSISAHDLLVAHV